MRPLLYTVLVGGYQPELHRLPMDIYGIAIVDQYYKGGFNGWHLLRITEDLPGHMSSRFYKMAPHDVLGMAEDDVSIYVDSAFEPTENALDLAERLPEDKDLMLLKHPGREFPLQEVHALRHPARQLITQEQVHGILGYWESAGFTGRDQVQPIGGVIVRRHTSRTRYWGRWWLTLFLNLGWATGVYRDQLTLSLSMEKAKIEPEILDIDYYRSRGWGFRYHTKDREHEMNERRQKEERRRRLGE